MKPIALTCWLATLLAPPAAYAPRRLLIPFSGVSSECIGAILSQGWEEIVCIEQSEEYCEIAAKRIAWWQDRQQETGISDPKALLKKVPRSNGKVVRVATQEPIPVSTVEETLESLWGRC